MVFKSIVKLYPELMKCKHNDLRCSGIEFIINIYQDNHIFLYEGRTK